MRIPLITVRTVTAEWEYQQNGNSVTINPGLRDVTVSMEIGSILKIKILFLLLREREMTLIMLK